MSSNHRQPSESLERPSKTQAFLVVALGFSHSSPNVLSTVLSISQLSESQVSKSRHRLLKNAHMMAIACFFDIGVGVREVTSETLWLITPDHLSNWKTSYKCAPKLRFCKTRDGKWTCREGIEKITVVQGLWCPPLLTPPHLQTMLYSRFRRHRWKKTDRCANCVNCQTKNCDKRGVNAPDDIHLSITGTSLLCMINVWLYGHGGPEKSHQSCERRGREKVRNIAWVVNSFRFVAVQFDTIKRPVIQSPSIAIRYRWMRDYHRSSQAKVKKSTRREIFTFLGTYEIPKWLSIL